MSDAVSQEAGRVGEDRLVTTGVRRMTPANTDIFDGAFGLLHCRVSGDPQLYRGVWAVLMFPILCPDAYFSLRYTDADDKEQEIGVVMDLSVFAPEVQILIRRTVVKQYYQQTVRRIYKIDCRYGLLFFDVETDRGHGAFVVPWRYDRTEDFGTNGKVLLDSLDNRYVIPDVESLPAADRRTFLGYIYW